MAARHGCELAARAAAARYGLLLRDTDFEAMVLDIVAAVIGERRTAMLLSRQRIDREVWLLRAPDGPAMRVVYSPVSATIITVLPPGWRAPRPQ